MARYGKVVQIR